MYLSSLVTSAGFQHENMKRHAVLVFLGYTTLWNLQRPHVDTAF